MLKSDTVSIRCRSASRVFLRILASVTAGGLLLQTEGCTPLTNLASTLGPSITKGIETGITNLSQALVLTLFI